MCLVCVGSEELIATGRVDIESTTLGNEEVGVVQIQTYRCLLHIYL